tara:strand:+ start:3906 stop:4220 length:315 start_codon:yes stop_codon:yes gene_type:complete
MGNFDPRNTVEFLLSRGNKLLTDISGGGTTVLRTPSVEIISSASGNTTQGVKGVALLVQSTDATVNGISMPNGTSIEFNATGGDTVDSIAYNSGTGTIIITYLT